MSTTSRMQASVDRVAEKSLRVRATITASVASAANLLVLAVALGLELAPGFQPLAVAPVVFLTVVGVVGAAVVYAFLDQRTDSGDSLFRTIAVGALLVSFLPDVALLAFDPAATILGVLALMLMHVVVATACIALLPGDVPDLPV